MGAIAILGTSLEVDSFAAAETFIDRIKTSGLADDIIGPVSAIRIGHDDPEACFATAYRGSPYVAAKMAGLSLDPSELVPESAEPNSAFVFAVDGGLHAPITTRYSNRDLIVEAKASLMFALPAKPGLCSELALNLSAARAAGIEVAGALVVNWPKQPDRVLLEEMTFARDHILPTIGMVPHDSAQLVEVSHRWPISDWLESSGDGRGIQPVTQVGGSVVLEPYRNWVERPTSDPRSAGRPHIMTALEEIITAEGPILASRAFAIYNRASGGKKLTNIARTPLTSAVYWLAREDRIILLSNEDLPSQGDDLLRSRDSPGVIVRELGDRTLEEVPLTEVAELISRLNKTRGVTSHAKLKRAVLDTYGLIRMTARAEEYLNHALALIEISE